MNWILDINVLAEKMEFINSKEPEVAQAISMVIDHIHGTYSDKYAEGQNLGVDTKAMLYDPYKGRAINEYQIARYLQRYITKNNRKSNLLVDLLKLIHYGIFEIVRRIKVNDLDSTEPKV